MSAGHLGRTPQGAAPHAPHSTVNTPWHTAPSSCSRAEGAVWQEQQQHSGVPTPVPGLLESSLTHRQTQASGRHRDTVARTGENGFVSVLESTSRDFQLLWTHEVGWDFLQGENTAMRKSPSCVPWWWHTCLPRGITRDASSWDESCLWSSCGGTPSREATLGAEHGRTGQGFPGTPKGHVCTKEQVAFGHSPLCLPTPPALPLRLWGTAGLRA